MTMTTEASPVPVSGRPMLALIIREARNTDCDALSALAFRAKAVWGYDDRFMQACRAELSVSPEDLATADLCHGVGEVDGVVVGFHALRRLSASEWDLDALFVAPEHLGCGVGSRLLLHACDLARATGATRVWVQSDPHAVGFYEAMGARRVGVRVSASIAGRELPLLCLDLATGGRVARPGACGVDAG
ncbi:MAG: GNAT family N-acetyltransferase [Rhodocyclaceae bacterium]|nr:GNAT family N-acetyltransferase [Rhodocyclaceae bacterium]